MKYLHYFLREAKNTFEFYLIPLLAVIFPRTIYFAIHKFICRYTLFYKKYAHDSYTAATKIMTISLDKKTWETQVKLLYLTDITDLWLAKFRPKKMLRLLVHAGSWKTDSGHLALGLHFGVGYVALLDLNNNNLKPYFVLDVSPVDFKYQSLIENFYRKARIKHVNSISGGMAIAKGGGHQRVKNCAKNKSIPIILYDAPQLDRETKYKLRVFNKDYSIASGFINLICKEKIAYQLYNVTLDYKTGLRKITINPLKTTENKTELISELSNYFEKVLKNDPQQWYFWRQSQNIFKDSSKS